MTNKRDRIPVLTRTTKFEILFNIERLIAGENDNEYQFQIKPGTVMGTSGSIAPEKTVRCAWFRVYRDHGAVFVETNEIKERMGVKVDLMTVMHVEDHDIRGCPAIVLYSCDTWFRNTPAMYIPYD